MTRWVASTVLAGALCMAASCAFASGESRYVGDKRPAVLSTVELFFSRTPDSPLPADRRKGRTPTDSIGFRDVILFPSRTVSPSGEFRSGDAELAGRLPFCRFPCHVRFILRDHPIVAGFLAGLLPTNPRSPPAMIPDVQ